MAKLIDHKLRTVTRGTAENLAPFAESLVAKRVPHYRKVNPTHFVRSRFRFAAERGDSLSAQLGGQIEIRFNSTEEAAAWLVAN